MTKIRFALVGCGRISSRHFEAIHNNSDKAELVAVCDLDAQKANQAAKEQNCKAYTSYEEMLKEASIKN